MIYDKGGWVFWMLQNVMGRDNNLAGLQSFIRNHLTNPDHALLEDLVEELRPFAPDTAAYDAFTRQWFFEVVMPEYQLDGVQRVQEGEHWIVSGTVKNAGTGTALVEIAVTTGEERFEKLIAARGNGPETEELVQSEITPWYESRLREIVGGEEPE